jgi:aminoglycoside phosphotransferase (APT) family kinase protein
MDIARVRARIRELSDLPARDIEPLGAGTDSAAFRVDAEWVVRFPLVPEAEETLRRELALLPELAPRLPVAVPAPEHVGKDDGRLVFGAYRVLDGKPLSDAGLGALSPAARTHALDRLAALLEAIHRFPLERAQAAGVSFELCKGAYHSAQEILEHEFRDQLREAERSAIARQRQVFARAQASVRTPVLLHADIKPAHLLHNPSTGALTGLLDWGDVSLGHGDFDLAIIGAFCGRRTLDGLLTRLDSDARERTRLSIPFLLTIRWLADAMYVKRRGGDREQIAGALRKLREHLQANPAGNTA